MARGRDATMRAGGVAVRTMPATAEPLSRVSILPARPSPAVADALTASGLTLAAAERMGIRPESLAEDEEVWRYYGGAAGGTVRYYVTRVRNLAARVRLFPSRFDQVSGEWVESDDPTMRATVASLQGDQQSQEEIVATLAALFSLTGHGWLVGQRGDNGRASWEAVSAAEARKMGGRIELRRTKFGGSGAREVLPVDASAIWCFRRGLERSHDVESPVRTALPSLRMIERLQLSIAASAESAQVPKLLTIASEIDRRAPQDGKPVVRFADELQDVIATALEDQTSLAGRVPLTAEMAHQFVKDGVGVYDLARPIDEQLLPILEHYELLLAHTLDSHDELLRPGGAADLNHWNVWQIDDAEYETFFAPLLDSVVRSTLTGSWLRPILDDNGVRHSEAELWRVDYDAAAVRGRNDHTDKAIKLRVAGLITSDGAADMADVPAEARPAEAEDDAQADLLVRIATSSAAGMAIALPRLGVELTDEERSALLGLPQAAPASAPLAAPEAEPPRSEPADGPTAPPAMPASAAPPDLLAVAACVAIDAAVWRAMQAAGNRARSRLTARPTAERPGLGKAADHLRSIVACDVCRIAGRPVVEQFCGDEDLMPPKDWDLLDRQLMGLDGMTPDVWDALRGMARGLAAARLYGASPGQPGAPLAGLDAVRAAIARCGDGPGAAIR